MKGLSIRESIEIRYHAQRKIEKFTQADGESLSQAWGKFVDILSASQILPYSDPELFQYFTTNLNGSTLEFLRRTRVSKFEDLKWAATLDYMLDDARSTGSLTLAVKPDDQGLFKFIFTNVSEAGDIDGVYISREGDLLHLRTSTTPEIETLELPTENEYLATLDTIVGIVRSTGALSIVADDASERKLHDYIMRNISDAGTIDDGVYARVEGDKIHFHAVRTEEMCEGTNDIIDVVPEPSPLPDLSPQLEPVEYVEPTIEELVEEMLADSYNDDYEALLEEDEQSVEVPLQFLGKDEQSADFPLQFLGEEFSLVIETQDAKAHEFHQNFLSSHHQVQLVIDNLKTMDAQLKDAPIAECLTDETEGDCFQLPAEPEFTFEEEVIWDDDILKEMEPESFPPPATVQYPPLSFFETEDPAPEIIAPTQGESFTTFLSTFDAPPLFDDYPIFDIDVTDLPLVLQENCIHDQVVHWDTYEENIEELPAADACDNDLQVVWDESESETDELPVLWDEPPTEELNVNFMNLPDEPERINLEIVEMVHEDMDEISGRCCQPNLNLIIYVDDPLWETFILGLEISQQIDASHFPHGKGGVLGEKLGDALLEFVGVCEAARLAEPRKVQIEQLDAPIKIPDPPFLQVDSIQ